MAEGLSNGLDRAAEGVMFNGRFSVNTAVGSTRNDKPNTHLKRMARYSGSNVS